MTLQKRCPHCGSKFIGPGKQCPSCSYTRMRRANQVRTNRRRKQQRAQGIKRATARTKADRDEQARLNEIQAMIERGEL